MKIKCKKSLVNKLVEKCNETVQEKTLVKISSTKCKHNSCILYIVLFSILFTTVVGIGAYFVCCIYTSRNKINLPKYNDYVYHVERIKWEK